MKSVLLKIIVLILLIPIFPQSGAAQSGLAFSQAILITTTDTVPAGKVWKVESTLHTSALTPDFPPSNAVRDIQGKISLNGNAIVIRATYVVETSGPAGGDGAGIAAAEVTRLPLWLPAGTIMSPSTNTWGINVLEFELIP